MKIIIDKDIGVERLKDRKREPDRQLESKRDKEKHIVGQINS